jgi:hypothetical protein
MEESLAALGGGGDRTTEEKLKVADKLQASPKLIGCGYRVHTSRSVFVSIDLSPLNPPILGDFERILFSCSPRIGG